MTNNESERISCHIL